MKLVKMSLAAAMLMGASAYALDNIKVSGEAKLWYQTSDVEGSTADMFDHDTNSLGLGVATVGISGNASEAVSFNTEVMVTDTLGLENNLVGNTPSNQFSADTGTRVTAAEYLKTQWWASQANIAIKLGNTTAVVGRQELNTPFAFTEKWNATKNTFDAAVIINTDLPDTTLIGAWVGKDNASEGGAAFAGSGSNYNGEFNTFGSWITVATSGAVQTKGAYAAAAIYGGIKDTTLQGWYYELPSAANAYWLQADTKVEGISLGAQYAAINLAHIDGMDSSAYALKAGYSVSGVDMFVAYSDVDKDGYLAIANVATGDKTKLYTGTASVYADGAVVGAADSESFKIGVGTKVGEVALKANYTNVSNDSNAAVDGDAWDISAATTLAGVIGTKVIFTQEDLGTTGTDTLRIIATVKF